MAARSAGTAVAEKREDMSRGVRQAGEAASADAAAVAGSEGAAGAEVVAGAGKQQLSAGIVR